MGSLVVFRWTDLILFLVLIRKASSIRIRRLRGMGRRRFRGCMRVVLRSTGIVDENGVAQADCGFHCF